MTCTLLTFSYGIFPPVTVPTRNSPPSVGDLFDRVALWFCLFVSSLRDQEVGKKNVVETVGPTNCVHWGMTIEVRQTLRKIVMDCFS